MRSSVSTPCGPSSSSPRPARRSFSSRSSSARSGSAGRSCIVPNSVVDEADIVNTNYVENVGNFLEFEVGYGTDVDLARSLLLEICEAEPLLVNKDKIPYPHEPLKPERPRAEVCRVDRQRGRQLHRLQQHPPEGRRGLPRTRDRDPVPDGDAGSVTHFSTRITLQGDPSRPCSFNGSAII